MREPKPAHWATARRLFDLEAEGDDDVAAAGRVFQKTFALLSPILGPEGTGALFARSAQLASRSFPSLGDADPGDGSPVEALVARLRPSPGTSSEAAIAVCAHLLSLLETLIGERLTSQLLRGAWPTDDAVEQETK